MKAIMLSCLMSVAAFAEDGGADAGTPARPQPLRNLKFSDGTETLAWVNCGKPDGGFACGYMGPDGPVEDRGPLCAKMCEAIRKAYP